MDGREPHLGSPQQQALFAVLAVRAGRMVHNGELIDAIWGERLPDNPRGCVHTYVARLRRVLEPGRQRRCATGILESGPSAYRLNAPTGATDLERFGHLREQGRRSWRLGAFADAESAFSRAAALFEGTALGAVPGPFAEQQRAALAEQHLGVLEDRIEVLLAQGRHAEVISPLLALTGEHPLRERPWAQLMLALYRDGRRADALAAYERARGATVRDLGLDPGPLLTRLRQSIVVADPDLTITVPAPVVAAAAPGEISAGCARPPCTLPRIADHFTGRDGEITALLAHADTMPPPVCSIDGMAGVGKTALAVHLAHLLSDRYPDAQLYLDLHGHTPGRESTDSAQALDSLLRAVGVTGGDLPAATEDRTALWRTWNAGRRTLLILDNALDTGQIRPLIPGGPGCLVLVTSRHRLSGLDGGEYLSLDVLDEGDATALFTATAGAPRTAAEPAAVADVVHACGRLPLAIRIAAARLRHRTGWTVAHLAERLGSEDRRLTELQAGDRSVGAAFELSYRALAAQTRRMFCLLGLFPGSWIELSAAAALSGTPLEQADLCLQTLVDAHLLDEPAPGRYRLHDLLRAYAAQRCRAQEPQRWRDDALGRLLDFYLYTVDGAEDLLRPKRLDRAAPRTAATSFHAFGDRDEALAWLDQERGNLVPLVRAAVEQGFDPQAWQIARYLWGYYETRRHWADWADSHEAALPAARRSGDPLAEARLLVGLGVVCHDLRRYDDAVARYLEALALMRRAGFRSGEAGVLTNLGNTYRRMGRLADCIDCQEQSLRICRDAGDPGGEAIALANLGELYREDGRLPESIRVQQTALAMFRSWGDERVEGTVLDGLARTYLAMGRHARASTECHAALAARRACGDRFGEAESLECLGRLREAVGDPDGARQAWHDALEIADALHAPLAADLRARLTAA